MAKARHPLRSFAEIGLLWGLLGLLRILPRRGRLFVGKLLGLALFALVPRLRRMARANLERALGQERPPEEIERIARASFIYLGRLLCDTPSFARVRPDRLEEFAVFEGLEHVRAAYAKKRGVYIFSGHYGNWEMVALIQGYLGMPLAMVTRPLDNPHMEKILFGYRTLSGNQVIHKHGAAKEMLRAIRRGWGVAIVIDQNVRGEDGLFVDFFGTPASTTPALATLALKTESPVVPTFGIPLPDGRYLVRYLPEVPVERTGDTRADILALTQRCTRIIEEQIRAQPEYWVWMHRRWRTRPPAGEQTAGAARHEASA
ncbi:MAG TPA: lysophospholipid acyltransferase family protein [Candidatus Polarisedimenticolia bacterium]|nr:lysophospholipid acyltransferase family protein [Candidatus Polarisedimenticolia bacterium]